VRVRVRVRVWVCVFLRVWGLCVRGGWGGVYVSDACMHAGVRM